jgi:hypothetical protein
MDDGCTGEPTVSVSRCAVSVRLASSVSVVFHSKTIVRFSLLTVSLGVLFPLALVVDYPVARLRLYLHFSGFTVVQGTSKYKSKHTALRTFSESLQCAFDPRDALELSSIYSRTVSLDNIIMADPIAAATEANKPEVRPTAERTHLLRRLIPPAY